MKNTRSQSYSVAQKTLPVWQTVLGGVFVFGTFTLLLAYLPPSFSPNFLYLGLSLSFIGLVSAIWISLTYSWWARVIGQNVFALFILCLALRAYNTLFATALWVWLPPLLLSYVLAWILPVIDPVLSAFLWREQTSPRTRAGRIFLQVMLLVAPVAATCGASLGTSADIFGRAPVFLVMGTLGSVAAIGFAFNQSFQLWSERPWRKDKNDLEANK